MARKSNSDVDRIVTGNVMNSQDSGFLRMLHTMSELATAETEDEAISSNREALAAIYNAETDDDIWDADSTGPINAQFLGGCELDFYELMVKYSRGGDQQASIKTPWVSADGKQMYIIVTAARISNAGEKRHFKLPAVGELFQFNTSAQFLTAKLFTFYTRGKFGDGVALRGAIQATDLGEGKTVLKLIRVPERAMSGQARLSDDDERDNHKKTENDANAPF